MKITRHKGTIVLKDRLNNISQVLDETALTDFVIGKTDEYVIDDRGYKPHVKEEDTLILSDGIQKEVSVYDADCEH